MLTGEHRVAVYALADRVRAAFVALGATEDAVRAALVGAGVDLGQPNPLAEYAARATGRTDIAVHPRSGRWGCFGFPGGDGMTPMYWFDLPPGVGDFGCWHGRRPA